MQRYNYFLELQYFYPKKCRKLTFFLYRQYFVREHEHLLTHQKGMLTQSVPKNAIRRQS